jgi:hypothetical protein
MPEHGPLYDVTEPDSSRYKVFLDGNWMPKAFRCNTEEGWIERFVIGPDGRFVLEDVTPEAGETYSKGIKRERIYGKVTVEKR